MTQGCSGAPCRRSSAGSLVCGDATPIAARLAIIVSDFMVAILSTTIREEMTVNSLSGQWYLYQHRTSKTIPMGQHRKIYPAMWIQELGTLGVVQASKVNTRGLDACGPCFAQELQPLSCWPHLELEMQVRHASCFALTGCLRVSRWILKASYSMNWLSKWQGSKRP